jgi:hypothetical protein
MPREFVIRLVLVCCLCGPGAVCVLSDIIIIIRAQANTENHPWWEPRLFFMIYRCVCVCVCCCFFRFFPISHIYYPTSLW